MSIFTTTSIAFIACINPFIVYSSQTWNFFLIMIIITSLVQTCVSLSWAVYFGFSVWIRVFVLSLRYCFSWDSAVLVLFIGWHTPHQLPLPPVPAPPFPFACCPFPRCSGIRQCVRHWRRWHWWVGDLRVRRCPGRGLPFPRESPWRSYRLRLRNSGEGSRWVGRYALWERGCRRQRIVLRRLWSRVCAGSSGRGRWALWCAVWIGRICWTVQSRRRGWTGYPARCWCRASAVPPTGNTLSTLRVGTRTQSQSGPASTLYSHPGTAIAL